MRASPENSRVIVVSSRAPYSIRGTPTELKAERAVGGLVAGLDPVMQARGGLWVAWGDTGSERRRIRRVEVPIDKPRYSLKLVHLTEREVSDFYSGLSNNGLWPLAHYFVGRCRFSADEWETFVKVNQKIARAVSDEVRPGDLVWVHDYQLALVPRLIRERRKRAKILFFWHVPFPAREVFTVFPWRKELLAGLLESNVIGFHTDGYARNFLQCVNKVLELKVLRKKGIVRMANHRVRVRSFPMGVDVGELQRLAASKEVKQNVRDLRRYFRARHLALAVDRLDYTKGVLERLEAVELFLEQYPAYHEKFVFLQIMVPSRTRVEEYRKMKEEIDRSIGRINGRFSRGGWVPIHYFYRMMALPSLVAYYGAADVALVTPLRDGMNLVAKEYVACHPDERGVLILSEFAGAAEAMSDAIIVNPYNPQEVARGLAWALALPLREQRKRMRKLREHVLEQDLKHWAESCLSSIS
ncbi:MAG: trehalose-6-phosphate synthase [Nitrospirae bacterium]|nr:trehalose-6-phosphate synthase [Nitrospirota bacterium]